MSLFSSKKEKSLAKSTFSNITKSGELFLELFQLPRIALVGVDFGCA
jgi:hypothetical protein